MKLIIGIILLFALTNVACAKITPEEEWNKTFGGDDIEWAESVQQTSDGGYILAGTTWVCDDDGLDFWLVKTDSNGDRVWDKTFGAGWDVACSVQQTSDGGYILAGESRGADGTDFWLVKTDSNGTWKWGNTFGGTDRDKASSVQQTSDGGYILAGTTKSYGYGKKSYGYDKSNSWIVKTDSRGNKVWDTTFGGTGSDEAYSVQQTSDGGYILAGTTESYGAGGNDFWLVKADPNGYKVWDRTFGGTGNETAQSVRQTSDGGYILAGTTESYGVGGNDFWLVKADPNGYKVWDRTFGGTGNETAQSVRQTSDGGYILAGTTKSYGAGMSDFWLVKADPNGYKVWDRTFGGTGNETAQSVRQTSDGGYILAGTTKSYGAGMSDFWLVKVKVTETTQPINIKLVGGAILILITVMLIPVLIVGKSRGKRQRSSDKGGHTTVKRAIEIAKHASGENKPEIRLNFPKEVFQPDIWKRINVTITNTGSVYAKEIEIKPSGDIEFRRIPIIPHLDIGETETIFIAMKSTVTGEIPVDVTIEYKDALDRNYTSSEEVWVTVVESTPPIEPTSTKQLAPIEIKRGYEVLPNNDLRFGIRIINNTGYLIADVQTILDYHKTLFSLKEDKVQILGNIHPNGKRTAKYTLTPKACIHNEKIDATIIYRDHTGERHTAQMPPKEVHCVCPFLREKPMREGEFAELAAKSKYIEEGLSFSGIDVSEIADFVKESCTHRLHTAGEHKIGKTIVLYLAGESIGEDAYYLLTAVIQSYKDKDVTQIALQAYSDKSHGLHGFLNEIVQSTRHLVGSIQSAKEIGVIENKQVINIINSVVSRTSFWGDMEDISEVNIKDSVVHQSQIGSVKKCPNCGKEVQADEKFCTDCGGRLG